MCGFYVKKEVVFGLFLLFVDFFCMHCKFRCTKSCKHSHWCVILSSCWCFDSGVACSSVCRCINFTHKINERKKASKKKSFAIEIDMVWWIALVGHVKNKYERREWEKVNKHENTQMNKKKSNKCNAVTRFPVLLWWCTYYYATQLYI